MMYVDGYVYFFLEMFLILYVVFKDGMIVVGEFKIVIDCKMIDYVYVCNMNDKSEVKVVWKVVLVIMDVDMVVLGFGSLFISIFFNLVILEIGEVMINIIVEIVYICNIMI